jgi:hypothetical protein
MIKFELRVVMLLAAAVLALGAAQATDPSEGLQVAER